MRLEVVEPPVAAVVSLADAKRFIGMFQDITDYDALIEANVAAATEYVEAQTSRAFIDRTLREVRSIPSSGRLRLLRAPVAEVISVEIDGVDRPGPYLVQGPATITVGEGGTAVVVYRAGYGPDPTYVPARAVMVIRMLAAYWYERREPVQTGTIVAELPFGAPALMWSLSWGGEVPVP